MASAAHRLKNAAWRDLMIQLGIQPPDTPFNRRAAAYAKAAAAWAKSRDYELRKQSKKAMDERPAQSASQIEADRQ